METVNNSQQALLERMNHLRQRARSGAEVGTTIQAARQTDNRVEFTPIFKEVVHRVDGHQKQAGLMATQIETGVSDDLVGTMVASQKASLSFSALMQVRNQLTTAFDEIMKMPL